jgi:histidinol-phosphate aminotransferase
MTVRLRPALTSLPQYVPGRSVPGALKLASNETPYPPLPSVLARISEAAVAANRYPDSFAIELGDAIARRFAVQASQVVVGCGSVSLCQQLVLATAGAGDEVIYGWRSFEAYPIITLIGGAKGVRVPLEGGPLPGGEMYDLKSMAAAITDRTRLIFVCTPNNPTGTAIPGADLVAFLDDVPPEVLVVLDEAYREFVTDPATVDGTTLLDGRLNVIVLRTFSKAYGLAGLRVGYGIASDAAVSSALRQTQVPFAVTGIAQAAALASLEPEAERELQERVDTIIAERRRVTDELRTGGYRVPESQANFVWLGEGPGSHGGIVTDSFAARCESAGVIVRAFTGDGVRVTVSSPEENDRFLNAALPR